MSKKLFLMISFVLLTALTGSALALDIVWTNGSGDGLWNTAANWAPPQVPIQGNFTDKAKVVKLAPNDAHINAGMDANCQWLVIGDNGSGELHMTGGTLNVSGTFDTWTIVAYAPPDVGIFTMDGGTMTTSDRVFIGFQGNGTLNMNGGTMNIGGTFGIGFCDAGATTGRGTVNLAGGTINVGTAGIGVGLIMSSPAGCIGQLDITGGTLTITGDRELLVNNYITNGWITGYGSGGTVLVDCNITNPDKTTVKAYLDPQRATNPIPNNHAASVTPDVNLSWTAGSGATSHNVYFGTTSPGTFQGNQTETTFDLDVLDFNTTYYWRIDEVVGPNTVSSNVWTFTTDSGLAKTPNPINGAIYVALDKVLNWTASYGEVSHDVYLGTDALGVKTAEHLVGDLDGNGEVDYNDLLILTDYWIQNPAGSEPYAGVNDDNIVDFTDYALLADNWGQGSPFKGNTNNTSYDDPCNFEPNTTYYWRIDEISGPEKRKGNVWNFTTATADSNTIIGKVMCGYQGWFNCPDDGTTRGWVHWGKSGFTPTNCTVDMWPDMNEMSEGEKFLASDFNDGNDHYVFSSHNRNTVLRHFQWMQDYGIDGVYLQRFATEIKDQNSPSFNHRNDVLSYCKDGANMYGRKYAVMYDLSSLKAGQTSYVIDDWKYLVDTMHIGRDPNDHAYMFERGKPVVSVWGIGFNDGRKYSLLECLTLVNFLKNDPNYGGCTVMVGVPSYWRTLSGDCLPDPMVHSIIRAADIVSPWSVGRYTDSCSVGPYAASVWIPDVNWCNTNHIEYLPVIFPGYSFHNKSPAIPFNAIPRNGGQFLWSQVNSTITAAGAYMLYVAMFDEVDEGTAIFKITNDPPRPGGVDMFVTYNMDGFTLPSDEYLWLVGQACRALRGEIPVLPTRPAR